MNFTRKLFKIRTHNSFPSWRHKSQKFNYTLSGQFFIPKDSVTKRGLIIISHGYSATMESTFRYVYPLISRGFIVCLFDFGGYGSSRSRNFDELDASVLTEKSDLISVLQVCCRRFNVNKVILMGCSQGGLVSSLVANDYPKRVSKLILFYPGFSIPDNLKSGHPILSYDHVRIGARYVVDAQKLEPWKQIKHYHGPVLICHGTADRLVNFKYSRKANTVYQHSTLVPIKNGDHGFIKHGFKLAMNAVCHFLA